MVVIRSMLVLALVALAGCGKKADAPAASPPAAPEVPAAAQPGAPAAADSACTFPAKMASTPEETAWRVFVAATCPVNNNKYPYVVWQNWIEQNQLFGASAVALKAGERPRFHTSPLAEIMRKRKLTAEIANQDCNSSTKSGRTICEEARMSPDTQKYMVANNLTTLKGQEAFVTAAKPFEFTPPSIEIKADWIKLASCTDPPQGVHVEEIAGTCYALAGMHVISKLTENWVWATFEPQNKVTNPQRCVELGCTDTWGANPAKIPPGNNIPDSTLTDPLAALMKQAKLAPEWMNYRLDGVQIDFLNADGTPTILGNSIIEGDNVGHDLKTSSCITCHDASSITAAGQQGSPDFVVGNPQPLPPGYARRDFAWSLALAQ